MLVWIRGKGVMLCLMLFLSSFSSEMMINLEQKWIKLFQEQAGLSKHKFYCFTEINGAIWGFYLDQWIETCEDFDSWQGC